METVLLVEDYIFDLISGVYLDYPKKLLSEENNENDVGNKSGYQKLVKLILDSRDHAEVIDKLVKEKIREIFYGNPVDVFLKDKAKLEFGSYFKDNHNAEIVKFKMIVAIRNLIAHNNGRVDRKFIREADSAVIICQIAKIDRQFLKTLFLFFLSWQHMLHG